MRPKATMYGLLAWAMSASALAQGEANPVTKDSRSDLVTTTPTTTPTTPTKTAGDPGLAGQKQPLVPDGNKTLNITEVLPVQPANSVPAYKLEYGTLRFKYNSEGLTISQVSWKTYIDDNTDTLIYEANKSDGSAKPETYVPKGWVNFEGNDEVTITLNIPDSTYQKNLNYLEVEWARNETKGSSTSPLFAVFNEATSDGSYARGLFEGVRNVLQYGSPAKPETSSSPSPSPSPSTTPEASTPSAPGTASSSTTTPSPPAAHLSSNGIPRNSIIGIAVGVTVGGLLLAGALLWFFCFRRRGKTNTTHRTMPSYSSEADVHAMIQDKELPMVLESTRSPYAGGSGNGGNDQGRPSADHHYAPYSDRSTSSPIPDQHRPISGMMHPAATAADGGSASRSGAPTPTPVIAQKYAHLVEEDMTEEQIRRLEEEERQLDAAIAEDVGRRDNHREARAKTGGGGGGEGSQNT
ncbi:hypothetical protein F4808DRAFT_112377 [Astrocystis sublimbata]|nr:hypothetical protein F4808DRAFT_112377 [Astrocystis sublimbata]